MLPTRDSISSKVYELSVYNKYRQLEKENQKYSSEEIKEAQGMIRIELRIKRQKIKNEERGAGIGGAKEFLAATSVMAEKNMSRYLNMAYGKGRFVKMAEAKEEIELSAFKNKTKKEMLNILEIVTQQNMEYAKWIYEDEFGKYMKKFNELGISPITIERASDIDLFYHPLYYIEHNNKNYEDDKNVL